MFQDLKKENYSEYRKHHPPSDIQTRVKKAYDDGTSGKIVRISCCQFTIDVKRTLKAISKV